MTIDSAFTRFPTLTTSRLHLRQMRREDGEALFAIKSNLEVTRQYGQEPHRTLADTLGWIDRLQAGYERRDTLAWGLTLQGQERLIGACMFWNFDTPMLCAEIGYELHPDHGGQGIMTEALSAVLRYGFNELGLHRIEANPLAGNTASSKILLKLGFTYEGNLRQRHFFRGHFEDQLYFGLLSHEQKDSGI
jgi:[ribosomal protein S5]-alanine N-acetyltransferase